MKRAIVVAAALLTATAIRGASPVLVPLARGKTSTADGFHVRITAGPPPLPKGVVARGIIWFTFIVPDIVQKTRFDGCQLLIRNGRSDTLLSAPIVVGPDEFHHEHILQIELTEAFSKQCELRFKYAAAEGYIVKEYLLIIGDYSPGKR